MVPSKSKSCFVVAPIGADGSETRKRSNTILKHIFKAALEPAGFEVTRADEISTPGSITHQVLRRILSSELVVALTDHNPNVFYELAARHASGKPVIHTILADQQIPFDIADMRTIRFALDPDGVAEAREKLMAQVTEIEKGNTGVTPFQLATSVENLLSGKAQEKLVIAQLVETVGAPFYNASAWRRCASMVPVR
jgi:hypothetical protein